VYYFVDCHSGDFDCYHEEVVFLDAMGFGKLYRFTKYGVLGVDWKARLRVRATCSDVRMVSGHHLRLKLSSFGLVIGGLASFDVLLGK